MGRRGATEVSRGRRLVRAAARVCATLVAVVVAYLALVRLGLLPNPLAPVARGDIAQARSSRPGLRVLFVGNSFTFGHSMPELVHRLAAADPGGSPIFTVEYTAPFWSLRAASRDGGLTKLLHQIPWDVVVLQERSWVPSLSAEERARQMDPYAWSLDGDVSTVKSADDALHDLGLQARLRRSFRRHVLRDAGPPRAWL